MLLLHCLLNSRPHNLVTWQHSASMRACAAGEDHYFHQGEAPDPQGLRWLEASRAPDVAAPAGGWGCLACQRCGCTDLGVPVVSGPFRGSPSLPAVRPGPLAVPHLFRLCLGALQVPPSSRWAGAAPPQEAATRSQQRLFADSKPSRHEQPPARWLCVWLSSFSCRAVRVTHKHEFLSIRSLQLHHLPVRVNALLGCMESESLFQV